MADNKIGEKNFDQTIVLFFFGIGDRQILKFFEFLDIVGQFDDCHKRDDCGDTGIH